MQAPLRDNTHAKAYVRMTIHKNIRLLSWLNFFTDFKLYAPVAIIYFAQVTGSYALGMSIFSVSMIASALLEIPTGVFSDMVGRRKTVLLGSLSAIAYSVFYAIGGSFWMLAAGAVLDGLSQAFYSGNNDALLHDSLSESKNEHRYDEYLGKISSMFQAALAISAIAGSILAQWSFPLIMWLSVIPQILCFVLAYRLTEPSVHKNESGNIYVHLRDAVRNFITNKQLRLLSVSSVFGYGFGEASYQFQSAFYNTVWPVWAIGIAKTLSNLGGLISFHFSGKLLRRYKALHILVADNLYCRTVNTIATVFPGILSPVLMSTTSLFYGVTSVARSTLMQKEFTQGQRATMGSLNSFAGSLFFGVVAFLIGFAADKVSPGRALLILQGFMLANLFVYWKLFKHQKSVSVNPS